ncbi:uncharacterized protein LOC131219061 [Magnolia sinica]|uniref:uncharacterized protein LOC131219061 n=1 Tax=Magnolia sinica TaxID=86752 RepID=UPI00265AA9B3|nr:uncharacterized protein LOC131219061 [Magnolia sinica]
MSPLALVSPPYIDLDADDADMMMHLKSIEHGDARPHNVIIDLNPQTVAPENLPPNMLFLCNLEEGVEAQGGYWKLMRQDPIISKNSPTVGSRTTLKFYTGQAPNGYGTAWVMHAYTMEPNGSSSLCRVFLDDGRSLNNVEPEPHNQDDTDIDIQQVLMNLLEAEENETTNSSQVEFEFRVLLLLLLLFPHVVRREHGEYHPEDDLLTGNYLEVNDLLTPSSISDSTCIASMTSDECFNSGGLMFDPETGNTTAGVPNMEQWHADCRFNVSVSQGSHRMVIQPPPSGSLHSNNNPQTKETVASATMPKRLRVADAPLPSTASLEPQPNLKAPNRGPKRNMANEGPTNPRGGTSHHGPGERKTAARIAKLRRKYCCFFPI